MGRSTFSSLVNRAYLVWPVRRVAADPALGTNFTQVRGSNAGFPNYSTWPEGLSAPREGVPRGGNARSVGIGELASPAPSTAAVQGAMWSATTNSVNGFSYAISSAVGSLVNMLTASQVVPPGVNPSGVIIGSYGLETSSDVLIKRSNRLSGSLNMYSHGTVDASSQVGGLDTALILTPFVPDFVNAQPVGNPPAGVPSFMSLPGPGRGFYVTVPIFDTDAATGTGTVRRITMPFAMRLQAIIWSAARSTGNMSVRVFDETANAAITTAAPFNVTTAVVDSTITAANLLRRDVAKGAVLRTEITAFTSGTLARCQALLVGHTTGHFNVSPERDLVSSSTQSVDPSYRSVSFIKNSGRSNFSGPATGSMVALPFPDFTSAATETGVVRAQMTMPFKGTILAANGAYRAGASGDSISVVNSTKSSTVVTIATTAAGGGQILVASSSFTGRVTFDRGDVIQIQATTTGTAITDCAMNLLVHCTGHVNTNPAFD